MHETREGALRPHPAQTDHVLPKLMAEIAAFVDLLKNFGIELEPDSPPARAAWARLPAPAKESVFKGFSTYHRNCRELHASGISLRDNFAVLSHAMQKANLFSTADLRNFLRDDPLIEIYSLDHVQKFRSINFFDYCNYSMLDLLAREWFDLYDRLSSITEYAMREFLETVRGGTPRRLTVPQHVLKEKDSNPRGVFLFDFLHCCPLFRAPGAAGGYLLTESVKELALFAPGDENISFLR